MEDLSTEEIRKTFQSFVDITLCAICLDTVRPEMVQCVNGHLFCSDCRGNLDLCPTCRDDFSFDRPSGLIMQVVGALPPRCRHKNCGRYIKGDDDHERYCGFRPTQCKSAGCEWKGYGQEILQHVRQQHEEILIEAASQTLIINNFNADENSTILRVWSVHGQIFWHEIVTDLEKKILTHSFVLVANGKPKNDFFVKTSYGSNDMKFVVKIKLSLDPTVSTEDMNYIPIPKFMLSHFVDEDNKLPSNIAFKINKN